MQNTTSSVAEVLNNTTTVQLAAGVNNLNQLATDNCTFKEANELLKILSDLVNTQFKRWYCKQFYRLGRTRVMEIAALAHADGKDPQKLFSFLLKNA